MISTTFNSASAWLLDNDPNWAFPVELDAELPVSYERGITGRETRRPTGDTLRLTLRWKSHVVGAAAATTLRNSLQALTTEPVLCPFWPGWTDIGATPSCATAYYILLDGLSAPSIQPAAAAPFSRISYPLLVGYLKTPPDPILISDTLAEVDFEFAESDASGLTPPTLILDLAFPDDGGSSRSTFPFSAEWSTLPTSGGADRDIVRQPIGELRSLAAQYFSQPGRRRLEQNFTLTAPMNLLAFFAQLGGETRPFWLAGEMMEASLTANVASADTTLTVDNGSALGTNNYVLLNNDDSKTALKVTGVAGSVWTVARVFGAGVGTAYNAANTRIESLLLARFDTQKLALSFLAPGLAKTKIKFREVPCEVAGFGSGETIGTTMGALPATAMLFQFTLTTPGANVIWYLTSFERSLNDGTNTWTSQPIEAGTIKETDNLERQSVTLKSRNFTNNPLSLLIPFQLEFPLLISIYEGDVSGNSVGNLRCYYSGEVTKCDVEPPYISAECSSMSSIFDRNIPRRLYQPGCNWVLFESNCGLLPANWLWTAVVVSYNAASCTLVVGAIASSNGATITVHFFSAGYLSVTTAGAASYRMIGDNAAISAGQMAIYLAQPLFTAPSVGDVVKIYPGCDGQSSTCSGRFSNYSKFGGFPFMPVGNPSVLRITNNAGSGGKK